MKDLKKTMTALVVASTSIIGFANMSAAQAQLQLQNSPIRIQIGNGSALLGPNEPTAGVGISILSNQVGAAKDAGTSVRLLGPGKTLGAYTTLIKSNEPNGTNLQLSSPLDALTAALIK